MENARAFPRSALPATSRVTPDACQRRATGHIPDERAKARDADCVQTDRRQTEPVSQVELEISDAAYRRFWDDAPLGDMGSLPSRVFFSNRTRMHTLLYTQPS
jgi:hypothetical protein